jgi:hypothetical protein
MSFSFSLIQFAIDRKDREKTKAERGEKTFETDEQQKKNGNKMKTKGFKSEGKIERERV